MKRGHVPVRTCRSCRKKAPKHELQRFILEKGQLAPDDMGRGYGLYCCLDADCRIKIEQKLRKQRVVRADKERGRE